MIKLLNSLFKPKSVAVVGASQEQGKLGHTVLHNILTCGYQGSVYPVNPRGGEILGLQCYPKLVEIPGEVEMIVVVVPQRAVLGVMQDAAAKGVRVAVVITAGFREAGPEGLAVEQELMTIARAAGIRVLGPNVLGVIDSFTPLNASFAQSTPRSGGIAFMSQSGALLTALLDWAARQSIGFSKIVSLGNKADINEIDLLRDLKDDEETRVIVAYLEGVTDGQEFMQAAKELGQRKPLVVLKSGITAGGSRAVSSHTGTLAGSEAAYATALRQSGAIRADSATSLFELATAFAQQPLPEGRRLAIVTNAGGPGIIATDAAENRGLRLSAFSSETIMRLRESLPAAASVYNPVDILGDAQADLYETALSTVLPDPGVNGALVLLTPQAVTKPVEIAQVVARLAANSEKPILACFMGGDAVQGGVAVLREAGVPNYEFPERAIAAFRGLVGYREWWDRPVEEPVQMPADRRSAEEAIALARRQDRTTLGAEGAQLMEAYGLKLPRSDLANTQSEAVTLAERIGYPVVLKIVSPDILHKSDIGALRLNLNSPDEVRSAFSAIREAARQYAPDALIQGVSVTEMVSPGREVIIGVNYDAQFGHLVMFGLGGIYVEVMRDVSFRVAPLTREEALRMVTEIRSFPLLRGVRGEASADMDAIVDALLRVSQLVQDFPEITELDVNPLVVYPAGRGAIAVDWRVALAAPDAVERRSVSTT